MVASFSKFQQSVIKVADLFCTDALCDIYYFPVIVTCQKFELVCASIMSEKLPAERRIKQK